MRIISQNGNIDLPYEDTVIHTEYFKLEPGVVVAIFKGEKYTLGRYSTGEKAIKAMKMLREAWKFEDGIYHGNIIFQFPQDSEIEVKYETKSSKRN